MCDLKDLLKHEIYDLYSAEEQIIKVMPSMIEKAGNAQLKTALEKHLEQTRLHLNRLQQVQGLLQESAETPANEKKGLLARLFRRHHVCRGMQGLIEEGEKIMAEEMSAEVLDAAIIASAQKIEHYEICGYGTAKAFATDLQLTEVALLLEQTLNEEYEADVSLTTLAIGRINQKAESTNEKYSTQISSEKPEEVSVNLSSLKIPAPKSKTEEVELVAGRTGSIAGKKPAVAKNKVPKGEAERAENERETGSVRRVAINNSNTKNAKSTTSRKTTEGRGNTAKTKRSRNTF